MEYLRKEPPKAIGAYPVLAVRDYQAGTIADMQTGKAVPTGLPSSNVLYYELEEDAWVCVRPSGTEPKVKFYIGVKGDSMQDAQEKVNALSDAALDLVRNLM